MHALRLEPGLQSSATLGRGPRGACFPYPPHPPPCNLAPRAGTTKCIAGRLKLLKKESWHEIGSEALPMERVRPGLSSLFSRTPSPRLIHAGSKGPPSPGVAMDRAPPFAIEALGKVPAISKHALRRK